jgi:RNA polymerase sigma-70 factor, ECF subfamily
MTQTGRILAFTPPVVPLEERSDSALLDACAQGDQAALGVLYRRHAASVLHFCARLSSRHLSDLEDIVQEVFLAAWRGAADFEHQSAVRSWLFGIAARMVRGGQRRDARRRDIDATRLHEQETSTGGESHYMSRQAMHKLNAALQNLPAEQREAFVLCDVEGLGGKEAATVLHVPDGTLYRRLFEARRALRSVLEGV